MDKDTMEVIDISVNYDLIIVGAGACGIFAAWEASTLSPGAKKLLIERGYDIYSRKCPIMSKKARLWI